MNIQEIDKWLNNEYGVSYTKLDELNTFYFERYIEQKEEIERLNNIINKAILFIEEMYDETDSDNYEILKKEKEFLLKWLRGDK